MARTTWDVWVVLANNPSQTVAYIPRWKSIQLSDQLNDVGSATLEHDFSDPFFAAFQVERGDSLLDGPYALQIRRDGVSVFTFFIEDVQVDRAGVSQPLTIGGRGIASALEWGIVLPEDFSNQARATAGTTQRPKFFDRLFPGYAFNVRVATTGNLSATYTNGPQVDVPGSGARLTATANGSINNSGIDGVVDLVVGDTALVKNQTNTFENGVYWIVSVGSSSAPWVLQRTARADGSPISDLEVDNAAFVEEGNVNGYSSWKIASNGGLSNSNQIGTNEIVWSQVSLGSFTGISAFYILFKEADTGYEYSTKKSDFGTIKTLYGRGGIGYAVDWPLSLDSTLNASLGKTDSKGRVVKDGGNFNIAVGRTVLDVLNEVSANTGVDWHVSPSGSVSIAVKPFVTDTVVFDEPFGDDLTTGSAALLFSLPMLEAVETRTSVSELRTVVYGSDGFNLDRQISERTGTYGFREMFVENTSDTAPAVANITSSAVRKVKDGKLQITATFAEREGMTAWQDFSIGDKVLVEIDTGVYGERIISAIGASVDENGNETVEVTFGDIFEDIATNLKYAANYGRLSAAEIPAFTLRGTSSKPSAPTGTSVGAEVQGLSNRVVVNWEAPDNTSATQFEAIVYREEQNSIGIAITYSITNIYRDGNIAYCQVSSSTGFGVGDWINIYDTTDNYFDRTNVFLTSASGSDFTFDDVGPDIPSGTYTSGDVVRVVERHSTMVPSSKTSAGFENLGAPGREYQFIILPYTSNGQSGVPSAPFAFTASASAQIVLNGAIRSNNYVANTSGWTIEADGNAELNQVTIRNGAWVQGTLTAPTLQTGTSNPRVIVNSSGLFAFNNAGDIVTSISASTGALFSSSASISGNITANSLAANATITSPVITGGVIDIGGNDASSFHINADGDMFLGAGTFAAAPFKVNAAGSLTATTGNIAGFEIGYQDSPDSLHTGGNFQGTMDIGKLFADGSGFEPIHSNFFGEDVSKAGIRIDGPGGVFSELLYDLVLVSNGSGAYVALSDGDVTATNDIFASNNISAGNDLNVGGDLQVDGNLQVDNDITANGSITANGAMTMDNGVNNGSGISYPGLDIGPGTANYVGFLWDNPDIIGAVDNAVSCVIGTVSDVRMKTNIIDAPEDWIFKTLNDLRVVEYNPFDALSVESSNIKPKRLGLIAQEVVNTFPHLATSSNPQNPDAFLSVNYLGLVPHLLQAVQSLNVRIKLLESQS